ncbi:MAG: hypothetical protein Q9M36_01465 [Sulfurovum sp.]|nr:hypothetical protein [Sulfurovum sp.]
MHPLFFALLLLSSLVLSSSAQEHEDGWELGLSIGYANLTTENDEGTNVHLHLMRHLEGDDWEKYVSLGLGFEIIASDETHYATMITVAVHPIEDLTLAFSPGIVWAKHEGDWEVDYATHIEASYVFDVSEHFHIGPVVGYSTSQEGKHYTVGIHLGFPL